MKNKRVLLGITGGIAAYKITSLIRLLIKSGAEVKCIMTPASCDFISPLTIATLSKNPVGIDFWNKQDGTWKNHVEYGLWADIFIVAPLTANTLAKMVNGICDNLLLATYLSMKCPTFVAPAMDLDMYAHPTTKRNLALLTRDNVMIIPAENGELASGLSGDGRMSEPETIFDTVHFFLTESEDLKGEKILITAGPTYEAIDPVRFIGNHSTGKMGFAIAENCLKRGAEVILISGPSKIEIQHTNLTHFKIQTAQEMLEQVQANWGEMSVGIFAAAVADYRPVSIEKQKIKKNDDYLTLELVKNTDILAWAGSVKSNQQKVIGFALETNNAFENATVKLKKKNLDFIIVNTLEDEGAGFGHETNKISIIDNHNKITKFELMSKKIAAKQIVDYLKNFKK
ncbi:MAG: bifunctional phosphopantothenoylcysteine decarboxylase/phosphopantothenate--cysteine ligase CoaBC [Flavobacteriia bacterium]|nr:bifunctional phosphopantothenoylcysteine decarboxylase/phosphopantothenate--cysteine ligase CoaBC [Flavobacteriia bacterium]